MPPAIRPRVNKELSVPAQGAINPSEVARVAYELFERRGRVDGNDQRDWFEAERIVAQRRRSKTNGR